MNVSGYINTALFHHCDRNYKVCGGFHEQKKSESGFSHKTMSCQHPQSGHNSFKIPEVSLGWLRINGVEHG